MNYIKTTVNAFLADESGQDLIEYSLVAALLSCAAIATLNTAATAIKGVFTTVTTELNGAV